MKKIIVFDLGGVLIDWDPRRLYRKLMDSEEQVNYFLENVCTSEWNLQQDKGRLIVDAVNERIALFPQHEAMIRTYYDRWEEMLDGEIKGTVDVFRTLKNAGYDIYALTNFSAENMIKARQIYKFLDWFNGIVVSGDEKLIKPDPRIYEILLDRYRLSADQCIFIDDMPENICSADKLGLQTIHFKSSSMLEKSLLDLEIL